MTTERWDDERLDRLADLIESNARAAREERQQLFEMAKNHDRLIESNARMIESLTQTSAEAREERQQLFEMAKNHDRLIESNARVIQALANAAAEAGEERQQLFQRMDRRQEEIRGLQTENRRILDILLNQQNQEDDSAEE